MTIIDLEHQVLLRDEWLSDLVLDDADVMWEESGREYVMREIETGTAGEEGYNIKFEKMYLPQESQTDYVPF